MFLWLEYFFTGGIVMYPILLCSILGIAVAIERMIVLSRGNKLTVRDLPQVIRSGSHGQASMRGTTIQEANKQMIIEALKATGGNRTRAAEQVGISRRTLHRKLREFNLQNMGKG